MRRRRSRPTGGPSNLVAQLIKVLKQNPQGANNTQGNRKVILTNVCVFLHKEFGLQNLRNLKPKHAHALIKEWKEKGISPAEMGNRMSGIRWLARKLGKSRMMPKRNGEFALPRRERHTRAGKYMPQERFDEVHAKLKRPEDRLMIRMGRHFGMRFAEAALFRPHRDVEGNRLWIKRGTKGGRPRFIQMVNREQWELLRDLREHITGNRVCLVEPGKTFDRWRTAAYKRLGRVGISRKDDVIFHDLRRTWADQEFARLREKGHSIEEASEIVAKRLGHNRVEVLKWYLPAEAA